MQMPDEQDFQQLKDQVAALASQLTAAKNRIDELENFATDHLGLDWGTSLADANSPHPNASFDTAEYGGGAMRLGKAGIQILAADSYITGLWVVRDLFGGSSPVASSTGTINSGSLTGNIADNISVMRFGSGADDGAGVTGSAYVEFTASNDGTTEQGGRLIVTTDAGEKGSAWLFYPIGSDVSRFKLGLGSGASPTVLNLAALSSDQSSPLDGDIWYYNNKIYARINGATVEWGGGSMPMPPIVSTLGWHGVGSQIITAASPTSQAWPTSNKAIFVPITVTEDITVVKLWVMNGATASGNLNMSLYDSSFAQVANSEIGSTAQTGTNVIQELDITNVTLTAGLYYIALVLDNTTGTVFGRTSPFSTTEGLQAMGMFEQTSSFDLPSTATPAVMASNLIPFCGISTRTLVT